MVNKIEKPSRERRLLSGGLAALSAALALVASLLYAQPVIRAYWWIAAVAAPHRGPMRRGGSPKTGDLRIQKQSHCSSLTAPQR